MAKSKKLQFRSNVVFRPLDTLLVQVLAELGANFSISQKNLQTEFVCWAHCRIETSDRCRFIYTEEAEIITPSPKAEK